VPTGASYVQALDGGQSVSGQVVSWTVSSLAAGNNASVRFAVIATQTITNSAYRVSATGGISATGSVTVATTVSTGASGQKMVYLPIILCN